MPVDLTMGEFLAEFIRQRALCDLGLAADGVTKLPAAEAKIRGQLLKTMVNALYGKRGQGVSRKNRVEIRTRESAPKPDSPITDAAVAASVTGLVRAGLSSILDAVDKYNQTVPPERRVVPVSATTDGLLLGFPAPPGVNASLFMDGGKTRTGLDVGQTLEGLGAGALWKLIQTYPAIKQLRHGRRLLAGEGDILEIKFVADRVVSVKSRGQIATADGVGCVAVARFGHKTPPDANGKRTDDTDAAWLMERLLNESEEIEFYEKACRISMKEIIEAEKIGVHLDYADRMRHTRFNGDPDYKRPYDAPVDGVQTTRPHKNLASMLHYRKTADRLRKRGKKASPELVKHFAEKPPRRTRIRGSIARHLAKMFVRACLQGYL